VKATDLSALIASRLCHDLVSPVGAISNGLEIIADEDDPEIIRQAVDLLNLSVRQAEYKLTFYRFAFGASAGAGGEIASRDIGAAAAHYLGEEKVVFSWKGEPVLLSKLKARMLSNLILFGRDCLPRGGTLEATEEPDALIVTVEGQNCRLRAEAAQILYGNSGEMPMPHLAPVVLLRAFSEEEGVRLTIEEGEGKIVLRLAAAPA